MALGALVVLLDVEVTAGAGGAGGAGEKTGIGTTSFMTGSGFLAITGFTIGLGLITGLGFLGSFLNTGLGGAGAGAAGLIAGADFCITTSIITVSGLGVSAGAFNRYHAKPRCRQMTQVSSPVATKDDFFWFAKGLNMTLLVSE